jgi:rifampicin phosphotransferase
MAKRGQLNRAEDIMFLELEEAQTGFHDRSDLRATVMRRKGEVPLVKAHPGPASYGKAPPPQTSFDAFPPEARRLMRVLLWQMNNMAAAQAGDEAGTHDRPRFRGLAASLGQYTGPARIIMNEAELG